MHRVRELLAFIKLKWRIAALCTLVAVLAALLIRDDHNRGRFVLVPSAGDYPPQVIDTRTGQYCDPLPKGMGKPYLPKCSDLAKGWR
jgi:hypothetical protein